MLKNRKALRHAIRKNVNVVAFANLIIDHPERLGALVDELERNSGRLLAQLILSGNATTRTEAARNLIVDFLNKNIERIAGGTFGFAQVEEPPLQITSSPRPQVFNPSKRLYVNEMLAFEGKQTFLDSINTYLTSLDTPMYVFINYSQDVTTESYMARAPNARPKGLPSDAKFLVMTVVNIPGSVKYQLVVGAFNVNTQPHSSTLNLAWEINELVGAVAEKRTFLNQSQSTEFKGKPIVMVGDSIMAENKIYIQKTDDDLFVKIEPSEIDTLTKYDVQVSYLLEGEKKAKSFPSQDAFLKITASSKTKLGMTPKPGKYAVTIADPKKKKISVTFFIRNSLPSFACSKCGNDLTVTKEKLNLIFPNSDILDKYPDIDTIINNTLKKGGFNTCYRQSHFFSQCFVESGGFNASVEGYIYNPDGLLTVFKRNAGPKSIWFNQKFFDDKTYLTYAGTKLYEKVDTAGEATADYRAINYTTYKWFSKDIASGTDTVKMPTMNKEEVGFELEKGKGNYKKAANINTLQNGTNALNIAYKGMNGNKNDDEGFKFRGRGAIQLTGRGLYKEISQAANLIFKTNYNWESNYDEVANNEKAIVHSAAAYLIKRFGDLSNLDTNDSYKVTKKVNAAMLEKDMRKNKFTEYINGIYGGCVTIK